MSANAAIDKIAAVERLVPDQIHRPELLSMLPGGKAVNVARAATHLGVPATVVAMLGGHGGAWIADALAERGIPTCRVGVPGESRTCLSILDRATGALTEFYESGMTIDGRAWDALESALDGELERDPRGAAVVISGSLPPGSPLDGCRRLAEIASSRGAFAAVDVGGAQLAAALPARPWLVKVNAAEAGMALGLPVEGATDAAAAAARLRDRGASIAVVTLGVEGAVLASENGVWRIGPPPERGRFSVGSGDAYLAGLLGGLVGGFALPEAARRAAAVAVAHALVPGQGEFRLDDVERITPSITLDPLD